MTAAPVARGLLERQDLLELLDRAVSRHVTIISAPPGSGKTSLLRSWAGRPNETRRVAFASVEREQRNAQQFWGAVLHAIRGASEAIALDGDQLVDRVASELVEPVVLIIDDLHELQSPEALAQLEHLVAILPGSARLVLSSRRDPPIRLHRLRLAGEVAEIRAGDLRFTERETRELLTASGIGLSDAGAAALHQRTEGWAAGLRLAAISLTGHPDPERFVAEFSGGDRAVGEYLLAEMLERQPVEVQRMLLRTSLVDRVNGELADLLAGRAGSEQMLLALDDANAFVVSLDPQRTWFRYHHMLADFLRLELRRTLAHEVPDIHRRAARWFEDQGDSVEAVRHLLAAGDWPDAARLLADDLFSLTLDGQEETVAALLRSFPAGVAAEHPELALAHAVTQLARGRLEEAAAQLTLAESHVQSAAPARRSRLAVAIASQRLALARRSGQLTQIVEQVHLLDESTRDGSDEQVAMGSELRGVALMHLGIVETWCGQLADAERHLSEGAALARSIRRPYLELVCRAHQGFPSRQVSLAAARERGRQVVAFAERHGWDDRPVLAPALGALAGATLWTAEFDEAELLLRRAWEVGEAQIDPAAEVLLHVATGMLHSGRGEQQRAAGAFAAAALVQSRITGVHALRARIAGWLAAAQARLGRTEEARASLAGFTAEPERMGEIHNARAVIAMAEGDPAAALEALQEVGEVSAFTLVETRLLAGIAHLQLGDRNRAAAAVEAALAAAEPDRLILPFAMTGAAAVLDVLPHHATAHGALLADVGDALRGAPPSGDDGERRAEPEELSPSELRVLRYLPTNLTRPEIARELYVSVNTVNTHIRRIYSKLGATDRSSAVRHARELRLLSTAHTITGIR